MRRCCIVGTYATKMGRLGRSASDLSIEAIHGALADAGLRPDQVDGIVAVPSLAEPHFMAAHYLATKASLFDARNQRPIVCRSIDTGGAGPVSSLASACNLIRAGFGNTVCCVAGDAVLSLDSRTFTERANQAVEGSDPPLPSPRIPSGYDRIAEWQINHVRNVTREQLAMVPVIMSHMAARHPNAMCRQPLTLDEVLKSPPIGKNTNLLECARRADGAAAVIVSAADYYHHDEHRQPSTGESHQQEHHHPDHKQGTEHQRQQTPRGRKPKQMTPSVIAVGEGSGPLYPPAVISESIFSVERAANFAYNSSSLGPDDIDYYSIYDCFPICFARGLEACRVVPRGEAGAFIQAVHDRLVQRGVEGLEDDMFPINTHGGLLAYGAAWEAPAMNGIIEAVAQLTGQAGSRQARRKHTDRSGTKVTQQLPHRALCYGNGGILSSSAVAILAQMSIQHS